MSRFDEFLNGMVEVRGASDGVRLNDKDFPSLHAATSKSSGASLAAPPPGASPVVPSSVMPPASSSSNAPGQLMSITSWSSLFPSVQATKL